MDFAAVHLFLQRPIVAAAVAGAISAAVVDYGAFRSWKSFDDLKTFNFKMALFRWIQGAVTGAIGASSYSALVG